jgi:hypothetical protein
MSKFKFLKKFCRKPVQLLFVFFWFLTGFNASATYHKWKPSKVTSTAHLSKQKHYGKDTLVKINSYLLDTLLKPIPVSRKLIHDKITKEQIAIDKLDGVADTFINFKKDTSWSGALSKAFLDEIDAMQVRIENMPANGRDESADNQQKIRYLRAVYEMLQRYRLDPKPDPAYYVALAGNMDSLLIAVNEHKQNEFTHWHLDLYTLDNSKDLFDDRPDLRALLYIKVGKQYPLLIVKRLNEYADKDFAGDIIADAAVLDPELIYYYASSSDLAIKKAVYATDDSLVHCIVQVVALSDAPLKALSFLPDLYHARLSIKQIDSITRYANLTFKNLVRLRLEGDSIARHTYMYDLTQRALNYVRKLNEQHEASDTARFKVIEGLPPSSLYFIMVAGQDEIYTSSFLGTFKRMVQRMGAMKGDQLLDSLHYDHFRTFIRMCAGYNTLSEFLATMDDNARNKLMNRFIGGLEMGRGDELEDAVDVADALGSIREASLSGFLQSKINDNYRQSLQDSNRKGMAIYSILGKLVKGNDTTGTNAGAEAVSSTLDLPPINKVLYKDLINDSGIVYQQVFFYGDKDGKDAYESFMDAFKKDKNWKIYNGPLWTTIAAVKGNPVVIYANLPLKEPDDEDAINKLCHYLDSVNITPTIMIHRGHSYHLPVTLAKLTPQAKIVILGSCGGYQNLAAVLDHAPSAHIISSKQTGVRAVNEPIMKELNIDLLAARDVNWVIMWQELEEAFKNKPDVMERFSDYVPPHKNLGAIFIKAYRKLNP